MIFPRIAARAGLREAWRAALLAALAWTLGAGDARAQLPSAEWRTLATPHFRLHYPAPAEAWTRHAAARLEAIRERVAAEVGYAPPEVVDVLVADPQAAANGLALPILGWPRLVLWTTPPLAESEIGHYGDWADLLITHEEAHLAHLLRPSRNPLRRAFQKLAPVGPIPLAAPRWAVEGYATLVEGRLTGSGRPNGLLRAAILRRWAQAGKLPGYGPLAANAESWRGMSMAYLVGSAYLEWLEERAGPGSLRNLWARLTARRSRTFDEAFRGVFGDSPADLYDRFRAELTWRAIEAERRRAEAPSTPGVSAPELWQDLTWGTGAPALSPDGQRLALVLRGRKTPARLVVWPTAPDGEAEAKWQKSVGELRARDPQDIPPVRTKPLPRQPLHSWTPPDGVEPVSPRFLPEGKGILLVRFEPGPDGVLHPDLSLWQPEEGAVRRITRGADLRDPDPAPAGGWAVATRIRFGESQLVRVDLGSGAVEALTPPSIEITYDRPRVSPDGRSIAYAGHRDGRWRIEVLDLATRTATIVSPDGLESASAPAWSPDGSLLYAVGGVGGYLELVRFPSLASPISGETGGDNGEGAGGAHGARSEGGGGQAGEEAAPEVLTRLPGAALSPAPTPDGRAVFFLALEPDGLDLQRLELNAPVQQAAKAAARAVAPGDLVAATAPVASPQPSSDLAVSAPSGTTGGGPAGNLELVPALPPPPPTAVPPFAEAEVGPSRPYGLGREELLPLFGFRAAPGGGSWEAGVRSGDLVGRFDLLLLGAGSGVGQGRGGALALAWRGPVLAQRDLPLELRFHFFSLAERPNGDDSRPIPSGSGESRRQGMEAGAAWDRQGSSSRLNLAGGVLWNEIDAAGANRRQRLLSLAGGYQRFRSFGPEGAAARLWADATLRGHVEIGATGGNRAFGAAGVPREDSRWRRYGGELRAGLRLGESRLSFAYRREGSHGLRDPLDLYRLGGGESSLLPRTLLAQRLLSPGLPLDLLTGGEAEAERAELHLRALPVPLFAARYRLWRGGNPRGDWLTLAGLEFTLRVDPQPIARLPAFTLRAGVANVLSAPDALHRLDGDWRWWVTTTWRP